MNQKYKALLRACCFLLACLLIFSSSLVVPVYASDRFSIVGKSYELGDGSSFIVSNESAKDSLCYGAESIGSLELSGAVNKQSTYNGLPAIGATGSISLTYTYDGSYQSGDKDSWNLTSSNEKSVNSIDINKKVENGAIIVQRSSDGQIWETVHISTDVFHKISSDIESFYTISEEDIRAGSYFRVTLAYRMYKKTGTEYTLGFIPTNIYEYREFVEIREFYVSYNQNAVILRDIETGSEITGGSVSKGFIIDKNSTNIDVVVKITENGSQKAVSSLTPITAQGSYQISISTPLGEKYTRSLTVIDGMEMTSISPSISISDEYSLSDENPGSVPFGLSSLTTLKIGHQEGSRITSGTVSGFNAYGITGDSVSLYLTLKDFTLPQKDGWSILSDNWGKREKQTVSGTWAGVIGTGALVIQTSTDGENWIDADLGKYASGLSTTDFYTNYSKMGDILIYTPSGNDLLHGIYIRVLYAYQVTQNNSKNEDRVLETYELYLCSNELGAVTFHNLSVSENIAETLGFDNEIDAIIHKTAETLVSGSCTLTGFEIDMSMNPTVQYTVYRNGSRLPSSQNNSYTTAGKYEIQLESAVGTTDNIIIYVDTQSTENALTHYFGDGFICGKRIYSDGEYPIYEGGKTTYHVEANKANYLPVNGTIHNITTDEVVKISSGSEDITEVLTSPGLYIATFSTQPTSEESELPGDYRVFTFQFEIIAEGSAPGPVVNQRNLETYSKTTATDSYPMYYGLIYHSASAGNIKIAFATREAAVDYAYNYEKGTVEIQSDGSFRYTGSFVLADKVKYNSAWDLTDAMYYFAEQAVQELYFDMSDPYTYRTLSETVIESTSNLRTLELNETVTIFGDTERDLLCTNQSLPIISPKPYAYLYPGINGTTDMGYSDFEFIKDKYRCDSDSVVIIDSNGKEYNIAYNTGVGKQLQDADCPSGVITIKERTIYGDETTYQAIFIADGENSASVTLSYYSNGSQKTIEYTQADDGATMTVDAFEISSIVDYLDPYTLVTISDTSNSYQYVADQMATGAWTVPGDYEITVTNRLGFGYSVNVTVTDSGYSALMFTGEGTESTKAIVTQYGDEHISLPVLQRYGYNLVGYEDENGQRYTDEISQIMFKGTMVLNAVWEAKQYSIHFQDASGNTLADSVVVDFGSHYELPALSLDSGVEFLGWTANGETIDTSTLTIDKEGDIVLVASLNSQVIVPEERADGGSNMTLWITVGIAAILLSASVFVLKKNMKLYNENTVSKDDRFNGGDED